MANCFLTADILLPDFKCVDGTKWAVVACDQFTSQPEYWENARAIVGDAPSALDLILPEAYLDMQDDLLGQISESMEKYCGSVLECHEKTYIYVERVQSDGRVRRGLVGAVDLECYDWHAGSCSAIRATEGTVPERIPPRVAIRSKASIELPHIMLLIDDAKKQVIESLAAKKDSLKPAYDFDLMLGGGHISGWFVDGVDAEEIDMRLAALFETQKGMDIAVGDGNHSLATAKTIYEQLKCDMGNEALNHPARYALAELVNIHDDALEFEPIYRIVMNVNANELVDTFKQYANTLNGDACAQKIEIIAGDRRETVLAEHPVSSLAVGTVQQFLDQYVKCNTACEVDYIHGEANVASLAHKPDSVGFLFEGMTKAELFPSVISDGALPRKTFSMGHAEDKRYYIEARKII